MGCTLLSVTTMQAVTTDDSDAGAAGRWLSALVECLKHVQPDPPASDCTRHAVALQRPSTTSRPALNNVFKKRYQLH